MVPVSSLGVVLSTCFAQFFSFSKLQFGLKLMPSSEIAPTSFHADGIVNATGAGDALLAGIVHAGPQATAVDAARFGLECARIAMQTSEAVNEEIKHLKYE